MLTAYITQKSSKYYLKKIKLRPLESNVGGSDCNVVVDSSQRFQRLRGFGGAFTEAAWRNADALPADVRKRLIDAYFSKDGLRYGMARIPMHTTDFSVEPKTYVRDYDDKLDSFDVSWDDKRFDFYRECAQTAGGLFTMVSTWSPPAWMKSNNELQHGGKLLDEYKVSWAEYYCKFIGELAKRGITVDCLSVQNEPEAVQRWESCIYTAEEEAEFIRDYLHPALVRNGMENVKIILWDHNRDVIVRRVMSSFALKGVRELVWGIGYHWYCGTQSENLSVVHALAPDKALFLTECCAEIAHDSTTGKQSYMGRWEHGERYGRHIINDFNNYSEGWIDWNLCLDTKGGPTYVGNYCEAPIMVDVENGQLNFMSSYYYIAHFTKFIDAGATRLYCGNDAEQLYSVAFENPDGHKVTVIENTSSRRRAVTLTVDGKGVKFTMRPHSIMTILD